MKSLTANRAVGGPLVVSPSTGVPTSSEAITPIDWNLLCDLAARAVIVVLFLDDRPLHAGLSRPAASRA
jgi:hypothetical protein